VSRLVLGVQCVREALRVHGARVSRVLIEFSNSPTLDGVERMAKSSNVPVERVARAILDRLSHGVRHQGVAAEAPPLRLGGVDEAYARSPALILALDEIQDPQNFGAVVRSAVALGDAAVLWPEHASAPLSPSMFRASAGAIEHATLAKVSSLRSALGICAARGALVVGLDGHAPERLDELDLTGPVVLVLGSEGQGLRKGVKTSVTKLARLPMSGRLDSLNASTAAAIALYECVRQRSRAGVGPAHAALPPEPHEVDLPHEGDLDDSADDETG
jgi:23S rRNA (guanosine2251-2'-O)-methyltransferase